MVDKGNISRYVSTAARKTLHDHHRAVVYPLRHQGVPPPPPGPCIAWGVKSGA